jgi:putative membrane protein
VSGEPIPAGFSDPAANWQRLSPRSMVVRPLTDLARMLPLLIGLLFLNAQNGENLIIGLVAAALAIVTGLVHWATTRYLITNERVYMRHGLLNIRRVSVARDRIRTVDVSAHLLHRLLGVCRISVGTGRNDLRTNLGFRLDGVTRAEAERLRAVLLAGPLLSGPGLGAAPVVAAEVAEGAGTAGAAEVAEGAGTVAAVAAGAGREIVRFRAGWLRFAPLTMIGLVVLGALFGAAFQFTRASDFNNNIVASGTARRLIADYSALSFDQRILVGVAVLLVVYVIAATLGYIAVYWSFRLAQPDGDTLRVTRGLLSLRATTISRRRLRGVEISEPLFLRAARGARCIAICTGLRVDRGAEHEGSVLLPPAPRALAVSVTADVLGVPDDLCSGPLPRHGPAARRRRYTRALAGAVVLVLAAAAAARADRRLDWLFFAALALIPGAALVAADRFRNLGHRLTSGWLVTRFGSLTRRRSIVATDAIIGWRIHQTWFQRRSGLITLTATTAAGHQHYSVRDVPVAEGIAVAREAVPGLIEPFLAASGAS